MTGMVIIRALFWVAALYDGLLGLAFLLAGPAIFRAAGVMPPNHWGYVQFPAALLITFALMFVLIARDPQRWRDLIPFGVLLKVSFCGTAFAHWAISGIPGMWKPWAIADLVFFILFLWAWWWLCVKAPSQHH